MLVDGITRRRDIPHEPGEWMEFRLLPATDLDEAELAQVTTFARQARALGPDLLGAIQQAATGDGQPVRPATRYQATALLERAIAAWSYEQPVTPETIGRLDRRTRDWARDEIIALHFPEDSEEAAKNGSSGSIAGSTGKMGPVRTLRPSSGD